MLGLGYDERNSKEIELKLFLIAVNFNILDGSCVKAFVLVIILSVGLFAQDIPQEEINTTKYFWGIVAGNPIDVNAMTGVNFNDFGVRLSGGAWIYSRYGLQLDLTYILSSKNSTQHQVALISAFAHNRLCTDNNFFYIFYHKIAESEYTNSFYFGLAYNFLWKGFFIQSGSAWGTDNFEKPRFIMQIGYIHYLD